MTVRKMGFVRRQRYKVYNFINQWLDRKVKDSEGRMLTFIEVLGLFVAYPTWVLVDPYNRKIVERIRCYKRIKKSCSCR